MRQRHALAMTILAAASMTAPLGASAAAAPKAAATAAAPTEPKSVLPFVENDYPAALARARAKKLPIFADAWAPW